MAKIQDNVMKSVKVGAWVTAVVYLLNWILGFLNISVDSVFGVTPATGITATIGEKMLVLLTNIAPFDIMSILVVFLSASAIVFVGSILMGLNFLPTGKSAWQRTALVLGYGTAVFYVLLVGLKMPAIGTFIGLAVYYAAVAISMSLLQTQVKNLNLF